MSAKKRSRASEGEEEEEKPELSFAEKVELSKRKREAEKDEKKKKTSSSSLGASLSGGASASDWVKSLRTKSGIAARLDAQDEEFASSATSYGSAEVEAKGLRVMHDANDLVAGEEVVLTLADSNVLADSDEEENLVSTHMAEAERLKEVARYRKTRGKPVYDVYDHDASTLAQYDGEPEKKSFVLGEKISKEKEQEAQERRETLRAQANSAAQRLVYDVSTGSTREASMFLSKDEMGGGKKKKKKKEGKKSRRKKTTSSLVAELQEDVDDNEEEEQDRGGLADGLAIREKRGESGQKEAFAEKQERYRRALAGAMRATQEKLYSAKNNDEDDSGGEDDEDGIMRRGAVQPSRGAEGKKKSQVSVAEQLAKRAAEKKSRAAERASEGSGLTFSSTSEFLRTVKSEEIDSGPNLLPVKRMKSEISEPVKKEVKNEKDLEMEEGELPSERLLESKEKGFVEEEAPVSSGMAAALSYLRHGGQSGKGETVLARRSEKNRTHVGEEGLEETIGEGLRVDLQKYDEYGRPVSAKEAFRLLSQGFHGNAPGAMAQERRLRQMLKEKNMQAKLTTEGTQASIDVMEERQRQQGAAGIKLTLESAEMEELQHEAARAVQKKMGKRK